MVDERFEPTWRGLGFGVLCVALLMSATPRARACGEPAPQQYAPPAREGVALEAAIAVYATTATLSAVVSPLIAWSVDERDAFPVEATFVMSLASGVAGVLLATAASASSAGNKCSGSTLYTQDVALLDLLPLSFAVAPTLIAWSLSDAST
jgi:hypothetical protein